MPQELLRDVLRSGDVKGRTRRRISVLPISIAAHAVAVTIFVIAPLAAEVEPPLIFSPLKPDYIRTVPPPAPPSPPEVRTTTTAPPRTNAAPTTAPTGIVEDTPQPHYPNVVTVDGAIPSFGNGIGGPPEYGLPGPPVPASPTPVVEPQRIHRVGQGIREPKKIVHVAPEYPEIARRAGVEGTVVLEAVLDATGRVESIRVLRSRPLLDEAAVKAVRQWRYSPTELNGVPVPVLMTITVNFNLNR